MEVTIALRLATVLYLTSCTYHNQPILVVSFMAQTRPGLEVRGVTEQSPLRGTGRELEAFSPF
ncbi:hypothetical protein [Phormidesmis priestleyi]|uniref:hypothetical protein n=1 Tax=Phormidesmis priestleyi TaxID=268141 RepID=UPI0012E8C3DD|nr:hypothetical protein [Phormidesmis priestleyi]